MTMVRLLLCESLPTPQVTPTVNTSSLEPAHIHDL